MSKTSQDICIATCIHTVYKGNDTIMQLMMSVTVTMRAISFMMFSPDSTICLAHPKFKPKSINCNCLPVTKFVLSYTLLLAELCAVRVMLQHGAQLMTLV